MVLSSYPVRLADWMLQCITITVRDANLCTFELNPVLTEPAALTINHTKTDATCPDAADGSITISISGGRPPYTIIWYDGDDNTTKTGLLPAHTE